MSRFKEKNHGTKPADMAWWLFKELTRGKVHNHESIRICTGCNRATAYRWDKWLREKCENDPPKHLTLARSN